MFAGSGSTIKIRNCGPGKGFSGINGQFRETRAGLGIIFHDFIEAPAKAYMPSASSYRLFIDNLYFFCFLLDGPRNSIEKGAALSAPITTPFLQSKPKGTVIFIETRCSLSFQDTLDRPLEPTEKN